VIDTQLINSSNDKTSELPSLQR